ncbi:sigma 54-interacting transcriptional regulator [Serratia rhizosphaerae]|uniref:sigma 54-interacting transcriptional regulator n=1 Tax=Serratia rhizosphaerae TaxID=2597702 RepID=UPI002DBB7B10|nr:sigma 54-interacting transcriptional regulator [Serratia rhizosphaerae]MEB6334906.1 sigma 54-interacting transcriptional regulator [Serratia rhizosphaerae]
MDIVKPESLLMQIQPTILKFTKMLASVLQLEVEIVDATLTRVAGTGPYSHALGQNLNTNSHLLRYVIENKREKVVIQSHQDPLCEQCTHRESCTEQAFLGIPIIVNNQCIGVISLVAFTQTQQEKIKKNIQMLSDYVRHISNIFVGKLIESSATEINFNNVLITLIENMDQGVLVLNKDNMVTLSNSSAQKQLDINSETTSHVEIHITPLTQLQNYNCGHVQYIVKIGQRQLLITGQLHSIQEHQLLLMAFHQSRMALDDGLIATEPNFDQLIGNSKPMLRLKQLIARIAPGSSSVLIVGESGTGKEVVARTIHRLSLRSDKPFIAINCAAIPEQLLESELFGYMKGAFTGASNSGKVGLIQSANHGTLFLDEIGDMPLMLQAKLLRAIESREVLPIGASKPISVDIRIISATNQNLSMYIAEGKFREDLYYRLNVIPIALAPLRERQADIELLINFFLNLHTRRMGCVYPGMSPDVLQILQYHRWPGNVRELSNLMEYLINIVPNGEVIDSALLPPNLIAQAQHAMQPPKADNHAADQEHEANASLESMEKLLIEETLLRHPSKKLAAEELGIGVATLYRKIKKYQLKG